MTLKELFEKAENGVLTYEQLTTLAGESKFVDLTEGNYVAKQKYTDDLAARDTRINTLDETIKTREADLTDLKNKLETAGTDSEKLTELNTKLSDLQKQYDKDTKAYQKQLKDQAYKFAVNEFANKQNFTCQAAKRDFISSMLSKNLQMENDVIIGATDFITAYSKENADAFKVEEPETPNEPSQKPHFVDTTSSGNAGSQDTNPFKFNFAGVRPH